jgi:DNA gyrase subunit A
LDVAQTQDLMITCKSGVTIRMKVADISEQGRATQGVKLIRLDEGDGIAAITKLDEEEPIELKAIPSIDVITGEETPGEEGKATDTPENPSEETTTE